MFDLFAQAGNASTVIVVILVGAGVVVLLIFFAVFARYFRLWIQSVTTGAGSASSTCWA